MTRESRTSLKLADLETFISLRVSSWPLLRYIVISFDNMRCDAAFALVVMVLERILSRKLIALGNKGHIALSMTDNFECRAKVLAEITDHSLGNFGDVGIISIDHVSESGVDLLQFAELPS